MSLTAERQTIADVVAAETEVQAFPYMPGRLVPPCVIVVPGSPYLDRPDTYGRGRFLGRWSVAVVATTGANEPQTTELDTLTESAVVALVNAGYAVEQVSEPYALTSANATYLALTITTTKQITL